MNTNSKKTGLFRTCLLATVAMVLGACATTAPPPELRDPADPWEPYNRNMYAFNRAIDKAVLIPVATGYEAVVPDPVEQGVTNFLNNIQSVPTILNLLLQGRPGDAGRAFERLFVNTIFGIGGIFDIATDGNIPYYEEDFGQTLAIWGWEDSRYFILPFLGPSTIRDSVGRPFETAGPIPLGQYGSFFWHDLTQERPALIGVDLIQRRANLLPFENQIEDAFDEYLFVRDAWLQRRNFQITGESDTPDYDSFLEEDY